MNLGFAGNPLKNIKVATKKIHSSFSLDTSSDLTAMHRNGSRTGYVGSTTI
ncbi:MAG: hypothetical protein J6T74_09785 [Clostridia bacterium]|nr:hypothetical protein [Clostridia bacterium]